MNKLAGHFKTDTKNYIIKGTTSSSHSIMLTTYYLIKENHLYSKLVNDLEIVLFLQQKTALRPYAAENEDKMDAEIKKLYILLTKKPIRENVIKHRNV